MRLFILPNKESVDQQHFLSVMLMYSKVKQILGAECPSQSYGSNLRPEATVYYLVTKKNTAQFSYITLTSYSIYYLNESHPIVFTNVVY